LSLRSICVPASVIKLGQECFQNCRSMQSVTFDRGSHLSAVGDMAFARCVSLTSITIPGSVTAVSPYCFVDCSCLREVRFDGTSLLSRIGDSAFWECSSIETISLPQSVEILRVDCFRDCRKLSHVRCGSKLRIIETDAFRGCRSLKAALCSPQIARHIEFTPVSSSLGFVHSNEWMVEMICDTVPRRNLPGAGSRDSDEFVAGYLALLNEFFLGESSTLID
jgi:hypothetical protein